MRKTVHDLTLFDLPLEIRNTIYDHAFGPSQRSFELSSASRHYSATYDGVVILLSPSFPNLSKNAIAGLPLWLLTSRAICSEATEFLLSTRWFSPCCRGPLLPHCPKSSPSLRLPEQKSGAGEQRASWTVEREHMLLQQDHTRAYDQKHQTLLFKAGAVRNIALDVPASEESCPGLSSVCYHDPKRKEMRKTWPLARFLRLMEPFVDPTESRLKMRWDGRHCGGLRKRPAEWRWEWLGRFRHVDCIFISADCDVAAAFKDWVEASAKELVRDKGSGVARGAWRAGPVTDELYELPCNVHVFCPNNELRRSQMDMTMGYSLQLTCKASV